MGFRRREYVKVSLFLCACCYIPHEGCACELGKGLVHVKCEIVVLEQDKNTYSKEVYTLELLSNVKWPFQIFGHECQLEQLARLRHFSLVT